MRKVYFMRGLFLLLCIDQIGAQMTFGQPPVYTFQIVLSVGRNEVTKYAGYNVMSLGVSDIQLNSSGQLIFSCLTDNGWVYFLDKTPIAYNGLEIDNQKIWSVASAPVLNQSGNYVYKAMMKSRLRGFYQATIINGHISSRLVPNSRGLRDVPAQCSGSHCEQNASHQLIYSDGSMLRKGDNNYYYPVSSSAFVLNNNGTIFTGDLQILKYSDAQPDPISSMTYENLHDRYVIDFPSKDLLGFEAARDGNDRPYYGSQTGEYCNHRIAINDIGQIAFFYRYSLNGKERIALVIGTQVQENANKLAETPQVGDVIVYYSGNDCVHAGIVKVTIGTRVETIISKWAGGAVFYSAPDDCGFANNWFIFRRKSIPVNIQDAMQHAINARDASNYLSFSPVNCTLFHDAWKTDRNNDVYFTGLAPLDHHFETEAQARAIYKSARLAAEYIPDATKPQKFPNPYPYADYDCRGFVFAWAENQLTESAKSCGSLAHQILNILHDGYIPIRATDSKGQSHYWDASLSDTPPVIPEILESKAQPK